jgi:hypothetical protein
MSIRTQMVKDCQMLPSFFILFLALLAVLQNIFGFGCNLRIPQVKLKTVLLVRENNFFLNFLAHLFSERSMMAKVCFVVHYFPPFSALKGIKFLSAECKKELATACKSAKNPQKVYCMPASCTRAADFLRSYCYR